MARPTIAQLRAALEAGGVRALAPLVTGLNPDGTAYDLPVRMVNGDSIAPTAANIVGGSVADAGTVLTVPAGRTWRGTLHLHASATAAIGTAAAVQTATLTVAGVGATPAPGTILEVSLAVPGTMATAVQEASADADTSIRDVYVQAPAGNAVTIALAKSAGMTSARATARGLLL